MMDETDVMACPHCGARVPQSFQFCGRCGRLLISTPNSSTGERRQITVMFCDLVGSVPLSRMLDPEDFAAIVRRFQVATVEVIEAHDGYVAQYLGDGILAYFGYPSADEHVAERAVRAGLEIIGRIDGLSDDVVQEHGLTLSIRIGVHTGLVVVDEIGSGAHRERLALGETPNMAARLQAAAPTDTLVVSRATYRLIEDTFRCVDLGPQTMKGVDRPQHVYRVIEERHDDGLVDHLEDDAPSSTVGREEDIEHLLSDWSAAVAGSGRAVLISGEPGVGKSHLIQHVRARIGSEAHYGIVCRCAPNLEGSAFHPVVDWLSRVLNFYPGQSTEERLDMLRFVADRNGILEDDVVPLLGSLMTTTLDEVSDLGYSAARARERTEVVLENLILSMGADRPLLLIVEDIQSIDPSTRAHLLRFAERIPTQPILLVMTSRYAPAIDWPAGSPLRNVELGRLSRNEIDEVIAEVARHRTLPRPVIDRIQEKADGVPLYAQEFTKMILESGVLTEDDDGFRLPDDMPDMTIPSTLQDSLMARLDRLMPVKDVAQASAIFGRYFTIELLEAATSTPRETLEAALDRLVGADLLIRESHPPCERYAFRHSLLREAAYESMLKTRRARYHRRVARYLMDRAEEESVRAETIAFHLTRAGESKQAAAFWCRAGSEAQARWENEEAVEYFGRGLALVEPLPVSDDRRRTAFHLNVGLAGASLQQKGYSHPDVASAFERAAELASDLKDAAASIPAFLGLWAHYTVLGDHARAEVLAERLAKLAPLAPASLRTFSAMSARASTWFWQGDIGSARRLIETLLVRFGDTPDGTTAGLAFQHPLIGVLSYLSLILWCQGRTDRADQIGREAIHTAEEFGHPFSIAFACGFNSVLHVYMGRPNGVREMARRTVELSDRYGFPFWHGVGSIIGAWAEADKDEERAVDGMKRGLQALEAAGVRIWTAYPTALMAELLGRMGRPEAAMAEYEAVLAECEAHGEYYFMPEIRRLRARLMDEMGLEEQAARERDYALAMARRQTAGALTVRILNDMLRNDASSSSHLIDLLREEVDALPEDGGSSDLSLSRDLLMGPSAIRPATSDRA